MRSNPFQPIYTLCNTGTAEEKLVNLPPFPRYLDVELTNCCNFQCLMCPVGTGTMQRPAGMMDESIFNKLIDEIRHHGTPIRFTRWGEPTLHPNFLEFLKKAKENHILCHLNTNGSRFSETMIDEFIRLPLDSVKISFQGIDSKSYSEMRNINFFDTLVDNIRLLYKKRGDSDSPFIHVTTTTTYETPEQIRNFQETLVKITDLVTVGKTQMDLIDLNGIKLSSEERERVEYLKARETINKKHLDICSEVFDKLSINWDGLVSACCADYNNKMIVGDLNKNTLQEIWSSNKMNTYRKILAEKRYDDIELCSHCYDAMNIQLPPV